MSDAPKQHSQQKSLQGEAWDEIIKEWLDARRFFRQRRRLMKHPQLAFDRHPRAPWMSPLRFAIQGSLLLILLGEIELTLWHAVPLHYRFKSLEDSIQV